MLMGQQHFNMVVLMLENNHVAVLMLMGWFVLGGNYIPVAFNKSGQECRIPEKSRW
jgi:hypothetical protein